MKQNHNHVTADSSITSPVSLSLSPPSLSPPLLLILHHLPHLSLSLLRLSLLLC